MTSLDPGRFPKSEDSDPESVLLALETGRALWGQGEAREAIRWLRRAAQEADEAGNDPRALSLARSAADLATLLELPLTVPPPPPPPPPGAPWDEFQDKTIVDAPTTVSKLAASATSATSVTSAAATPPPPPPPATTRSVPIAAVESAAVESAAVESAPVESTAVEPPPVESTVAKPLAPRPRAALRVAVSRSKAEGGELSVILLAEGQALPDGAREALLVPLEPDTDFSQL